MSCRMTATLILVLAPFSAVRAAARVPAAQFQPRDYLSDEEADKIRDALTPAERIALYISFAEDRLKKFDYELNRTTPERRRTEILNGLLNGYVGCVDDGADQIDMAREKQADIRAALKLMRTKYNEFLVQLQKYDKDGKDLETYRDTLDDAIEGTKDALSDVAEAEKEMLPAPVRRKP
ncbi:MAG TPA: hypothetical protein VEJ38_10885 [Candidatus Acidoferrales bacterium]|nr:hypothetical protein [Candidatus Acidoferrales bacterium]